MQGRTCADAPTLVQHTLLCRNFTAAHSQQMGAKMHTWYACSVRCICELPIARSDRPPSSRLLTLIKIFFRESARSTSDHLVEGSHLGISIESLNSAIEVLASRPHCGVWPSSIPPSQTSWHQRPETSAFRWQRPLWSTQRSFRCTGGMLRQTFGMLRPDAESLGV